MNTSALKKTIALEIDYVKQRLAHYNSAVSRFPDDLYAVKMSYFYEGELAALTSIYDSFEEV